MGTLQKIFLGLGLVLGLGIVSKRFGAGVGLGEAGLGLAQLGTGITAVGIAPFRAIGGGLGEMATGVTAFSMALGDIGRGVADMLAGITGFLPEDRPTKPPGYGEIPEITPRLEDRANGVGVYRVSLMGDYGYTFAGAGKIFREEDRAVAKYREYLGGTWV